MGFTDWIRHTPLTHQAIQKCYPSLYDLMLLRCRQVAPASSVPEVCTKEPARRKEVSPWLRKASNIVSTDRASRSSNAKQISEAHADVPCGAATHPATSSSATSAHATSLPDLPSAWLQQLPPALTPEARLALFRACRAMRDLVLSACNTRLCLQLPLDPSARLGSQPRTPCAPYHPPTHPPRHSPTTPSHPPTRAPAQATPAQPTPAPNSLSLACQQCSNITLQLCSSRMSYLTGRGRLLPFGSLDALSLITTTDSSTQAPAVVVGLRGVKSIVLKDLALRTLVPDWITHFPCVTSLQLLSCQFSRDRRTTDTNNHTTIQGQPPNNHSTGQGQPPNTSHNLGQPPNIGTTSPGLGQLTSRAAHTQQQQARAGCTADNSSSTSPDLGQLKHLHLHRTADSATPSEHLYGHWQQQLRHLTGLQSLSLRSDHDPPTPAAFLDCCSSLGTQLTQLSLAFLPVHKHLPVQLTQGCFAGVLELSVASVWVADADMDMLLGMPSVRHVRCRGFQLQHSHTHRPCGWTQISFSHLDIGSFALLPLGGVQSLQVSASTESAVVFLIPSSDLEATVLAVAAITRCGGLQWGRPATVGVLRSNPALLGPTVHPVHDPHGHNKTVAAAAAGGTSPRGSAPRNIIIDNSEVRAPAACLAALLPLLSPCKLGCLLFTYAAPVTGELLAAIKQHLAGTQVQSVSFDACTWETDACRMVLPSLPPQVKTIRLWNAQHSGDTLEVTESQVTTMCVHATRPVVLVVDVGDAVKWRAGWGRRVRVAMAAAGHQHVTVVDKARRQSGGCCTIS